MHFFVNFRASTLILNAGTVNNAKDGFVLRLNVSRILT